MSKPLPTRWNPESLKSHDDRDGPANCWKGCAPVLRGLLDRDADRTDTFYDSLTHDERVALQIVVDTLGKE